MESLASPFADRLLAAFAEFPSCLVAYSGGVDSAVVAKAAALALGDRALAVTGVSASLAAGELDAARELAAAIGVAHVELATDELADADYLRNAHDRCFHCKTELYRQLRAEADRRGFATVVNGANADDLGDFRPGMQAAADYGVRSPLAECGLSKADVRALARHWNLSAWDKPATPCLSSRVVYGLSITPERLARIDAAEQALRALGISPVRVRLHADDLARIEVPVDFILQLADSPTREAIAAKLRELGFKYVTLDLEGFRSGSFQQLVPSEALVRFGAAETRRQSSSRP